MKFRFSILPSLIVTLGLGLFAQALAQTGLGVADDPELGQHLVNADGMALYLYLPDEAQQATCEGGCSVGRPPLLAEGDVEAADGVDASLLGTVERADGTTQVTYGGWPLYGFRRDRQPGDTTGHTMADGWFLVAPAGEPLRPADDGNALSVEDEAFQALMSEGAGVFARLCAGCHGAEGNEARATHVEILAGNRRAVGDAQNVIQRVVHGGTYMPAFGAMLSDLEVAAVATFVRNSWGNEYGPVTEEEVVEQR